MKDLDSVRTWCEFGAALEEKVKLSNASLSELGHGVIHRGGRGKVTTSYISRATYYRILKGQSRPPSVAVSGILRNIKVPDCEIGRWLACWKRLMVENAATAHILERAAAKAEVLQDRADSPGSTAQQLMELILRRRGRLTRMRARLGVNHPYVVTYGFDTTCYVRALVEPEAVHRLLLAAIEQSMHEGHGRPRRFGTAEKLLGRVDEYLMIVNAVEEELLVGDTESGHSEGPEHDPFQMDFAELRQQTTVRSGSGGT